MNKDLVGLSLRERMDYAQAMAAADLLPPAFKKNPPNVLVAVEYARSLGIEPIQALSGIAVINGRPSLSSDLMASVVRRAGHRLRVKEDSGGVTAVLIRRDDPDFEFTVRWDREKAVQAGLWGKSMPWKQYPMQMLRARAISEVCRQGASDALSGLIYTPEELGAVVDGDENVIEVEATVDSPGVVVESGGVKNVSVARSELVGLVQSRGLSRDEFSELIVRAVGVVKPVGELTVDECERVEALVSEGAHV